VRDEGLLEAKLVSRIERLLGAEIGAWRRVEGGYTPALRLLCQTAAGNFFVKVGTTPLTSQSLRREIHHYELIHGEFIPRLVGWEDDETAPILVIEDLSSWHWPPPWDVRKIELVLAQIEAMHNTGIELEPFAQAHPGFGSSWRAVAADPAPFLSLGYTDTHWLETALPILIAAEDGCPTEGDRLTHYDLRSDNMCLANSRAIFVDWNLACLSNPELDLGFWLPSLAFEGGAEPETILPHAPEVAAMVAGFFAARAGLPEISDAPRVRLVQRQQLSTALPWVVRTLGLPAVKRGIVGD
jgi:thiamine kinase-like enzyme